MSETYRIKPLVWHLLSKSSTFESHNVQTAFGQIRCEGYPNTDQWFFWRLAYPKLKFATLDEAKAAAESWYRNKLLEALDEVK